MQKRKINLAGVHSFNLYFEHLCATVFDEIIWNSFLLDKTDVHWTLPGSMIPLLSWIYAQNRTWWQVVVKSRKDWTLMHVIKMHQDSLAAILPDPFLILHTFLTSPTTTLTGQSPHFLTLRTLHKDPNHPNLLQPPGTSTHKYSQWDLWIQVDGLWHLILKHLRNRSQRFGLRKSKQLQGHATITWKTDRFFPLIQISQMTHKCNFAGKQLCAFHLLAWLDSAMISRFGSLLMPQPQGQLPLLHHLWVWDETENLSHKLPVVVPILTTEQRFVW